MQAFGITFKRCRCCCEACSEMAFSPRWLSSAANRLVADTALTNTSVRPGCFTCIKVGDVSQPLLHALR